MNIAQTSDSVRKEIPPVQKFLRFVTDLLIERRNSRIGSVAKILENMRRGWWTKVCERFTTDDLAYFPAEGSGTIVPWCRGLSGCV